MECPNCKIDIGDATLCPGCRWSTENPIADSTQDELTPEPEEWRDSGGREAVQDGSEPTVPAKTEAGDADTDEPEPGRGDAPDVRFETKHAKIRDQIGYLINLFYGPEGQSRKQKHSLYTDTYPLNESSIDPPECLSEELVIRSRELKEAHLLVMACADSKIAFSAAHCLIDKLGISDSRQKRGYNVKENFQEDPEITIDSFLPEKEDGKKAVIVDARSNSGQAFVTALIDDSMARDRLRGHGVYLLCIVSPAYIRENQHYPNWKISYLDCLLKSHFPTRYLELKNEIEKQVEVGWWNTEESKLCDELKGYIDEGEDKLVDVIEKRKGVLPDPPPPKSIFIDEQHIEKIVVYVAAYFPDVTPGEFCELVEALLPDREVFGAVPDDKRNPEIGGSNEPSRRPIIEIWRDHKDEFMWRHLRETVSPAENKVIDFAYSRARESIKRYLGNFRRYYVKDQFSILQSRGFLFHPSTRVTENMIKLTAENAGAYPDEYNKDWLVGIIKSLRDRYQSGQSTSQQSENRLFYFLDRVPFNKSSWGYSRLSELIRELMKAPQTADLVNRSLSDLMRLRYYDAVLNVVKRLRLAADFDGLYWLKQLFDRGDSDIRSQAFNYLYYTAKETDADIHQTLGKLESWLSTPGRNRGDYPKSTCFALRLLIKYCFETIYRFNQNDNDSQPIEYPLFRFVDEMAAYSGISQLVKWLLHPAVAGTLRDLESDPRMKNALSNLGFDKDPGRLLGILLAEWSVILASPSQFDTATSSETANSIQQGEGSEPVADVLKLLLNKIGSHLSEGQQKNLIIFWEESNRELLRSMSNSRLAREKRDQLAVRWNRVFSLTQEFRKMHLVAVAS